MVKNLRLKNKRKVGVKNTNKKEKFKDRVRKIILKFLRK